jgi:hypothetical protein
MYLFAVQLCFFFFLVSKKKSGFVEISGWVCWRGHPIKCSILWMILYF